MLSLKSLYQEIVEEKQIVKTLNTYSFQQDPVEILFGKIRSLNGFNDNPTCEQFSAALRKLLAYNTIMFSKFSNCKVTEDCVSNPNSNILSITSKRTAAPKFNQEVAENITLEKIDEFYEKLSQIEASEEEQNEELTDCTITHIAGRIENSIKSTKQFKCQACKHIFEENGDGNATMSTVKPCQSTFAICKQTDRFLKVDLLRAINFDIMYHEILHCLDFNALYDKTDFTEHLEHKIFLIRYVVDEYIRIKGTQMAQTATFKEHEKSLRVKLHKLLHFLGQ